MSCSVASMQGTGVVVRVPLGELEGQGICNSESNFLLA